MVGQGYAPTMKALSPAFLLASLLTPGCSFGLALLDLGEDDTGRHSGNEGDADADADADVDQDDSGASDDSGGSDGGTTAGTIDVDSIDPAYGTNAGGTPATILGGPFDESTKVTFGSTPATVDSWTTAKLEVTTPATSSTGEVNVKVSSGADSGKLTNGFTYFEDGTGKGGALGEMQWFEPVGGYWSSADQFGFAYLTLVEPTTTHTWQFYVGTMDTCENDSWTGAPGAYILDTGASVLTLKPTSGTPYDLSWDSATGWFALDELAPGQYSENSWYGLAPIDSTSFPAMEMDFFARASGRMSITTPAIAGSQAPNITKNQIFSWNSGGVTADWILLQMGITNAAGDAFEDWIYCVASNDGNFTVDGTKWATWASGRAVYIYIASVREEGGVMPHNNSNSWVAGEYFMVGAGNAQ